MNAGVADAGDLGWLLGARLRGWGAAGILDAYQRERLPITEQVSHFAMNHANTAERERRAVPAEIEAEGLVGAAARAVVGRASYELNVEQYCCAGLNFGYFYDRSPIIAYDGAPHPPYTMGTFTPSTVPGCRTPHLWLPNGRSLYDEFGPWYTLLRFDRKVEVDALLGAAADRDVPLGLLDLEAGEAAARYETKLVIARPDQHVAWRGDVAPADPLALIDRLRGAEEAPTGFVDPRRFPHHKETR